MRATLHDNRASFLDLPINLSIGGAVQSGYLYAREHDYDVAIQIDGDDQHDPADIPGLINELTSTGVDCAVGPRFITNEGFQSSFVQRIGIRFLSSLT